MTTGYRTTRWRLLGLSLSSAAPPPSLLLVAHIGENQESTFGTGRPLPGLILGILVSRCPWLDRVTSYAPRGPGPRFVDLVHAACDACARAGCGGFRLDEGLLLGPPN